MVDPLPQKTVLDREPSGLQAVAQQQLYFVHLEGLGEIVISTEFHSLYGAFGIAVGGHHVDNALGITGMDRLEKIQTRSPRHLQIRQDEVERRVIEGIHRLSQPGRGGDVIPLLLQHDLEKLAHPRLVVDDQDPGWEGRLLLSRGHRLLFGDRITRVERRRRPGAHLRPGQAATPEA